jgi:hypothetical protein
MSAYEFILDMSQEERIIKLTKRVEQLEEQNQILYEWVQYFKQHIKVTEDERRTLSI